MIFLAFIQDRRLNFLWTFPISLSIHYFIYFIRWSFSHATKYKRLCEKSFRVSCLFKSPFPFSHPWFFCFDTYGCCHSCCCVNLSEFWLIKHVSNSFLYLCSLFLQIYMFFLYVHDFRYVHCPVHPYFSNE